MSDEKPKPSKPPATPPHQPSRPVYHNRERFDSTTPGQGHERASRMPVPQQPSTPPKPPPPPPKPSPAKPAPKK